MTPLTSSERLSKTSDILHRLLIHGLPGLYFLITVSFYLRTYDSAEIKLSLFEIGGVLLVTLWLAKILIDGRWPFEKRDWVLVAPFLGLLVSGLVSYAHAPYKAMSFDETTRRFFYIAFALIVLSEFRTDESIRRLLRWVLAAATVVLFYGLVQYIDSRVFAGQPNGIDPFVWRGAFGRRVFSTFGNPNFFGNFLVLMTPIFLAEYLRRGGPVSRPFMAWGVTALLLWIVDNLTVQAFGPVSDHLFICYQIGFGIVSVLLILCLFRKIKEGMASLLLLGMSVILLCLYSTDTKGALVGLTVAVVVTTVLVMRYFIKGDITYIKKLLAGVLVAVTLGSSLLLGYSIKRRMTSVNFRVFTWIATWEMIHTHPVFGAGIGSFRTLYPAYRRPEIILLEAKSNTETDHAEEEYLETWNDEGIFGFGIYLWFLLTVILSGLSGLRSLSSRKDESVKTRGSLEIIAAHPHAYDLLGVLGAFCGGLIHWTMDVSVRFVSGGIYFALLPAMVVRLSNGVSMETPVCSLRTERYIRGAWSLFWFGLLLSFQMPLWMAAVSGVAYWGLSEALDMGLIPISPAGTSSAAAEEKTPVRPLNWIRGILLVIILCGAGWSASFFRDFFLADLHHNIGIFFSKNNFWNRSPEFDTRTPAMAPELQEEYRQVGGALEEYEETSRLNPFFPMSKYFIGNVYNDWGSEVDAQSRAARAHGDNLAAETFRDTARKYWEKALEAYEATRALAPNYVQVHHQIGITHNKMGDQALFWGQNEEAQKQYDLAKQNLELYREEDPVYLPNYEQLATYYVRRHDFDGLIHLYEDAERVYLSGNPEDYPDRLAELDVTLGKVHYLKASQTHPGAKFSLEWGDAKASENYFLAALHQDPNRADAIKGLAILYLRAGLSKQARPYWERLAQLTPEDPDLQTVFKPVPR